MAHFFNEPSRTFSEYLLIPGYTSEECIPANVSLRTPLVKYRKGVEEPALSLNIPMTSAVMQSVSNDTLAIALAKEGGISFIYGSQSIESQAAMVARVKGYKAGFVTSASNLTPDNTLADVLALKDRNGFSTMAVTDDGSANGKLLGIVTGRDYRLSRMTPDTKVADFMTPREKLIVGSAETTLSAANDIIWENKLNSLPIVDSEDRLMYFVFRKDYSSHKENPLELLDEKKRYLVGAGINTRDYAQRVPALIEAGVDVLVIDSSEGYTCWQAKTIAWVREHYGDTVKIGAGNVVDKDGFLFLANAGADFIKVGIGGGSICITRETKGIGRGQASAVIDVATARDEYFRNTGSKQSGNTLGIVTGIDTGADQVTLLVIQQFQGILLVGGVVLAEDEVHQMILIVNDGQAVQLVIPDDVVGFLQSGLLGSNHQLLTGSHEGGNLVGGLHAGHTVVTAGDDAQQLAVGSAVLGDGNGGEAVLGLQSQNVSQGVVGSQVGSGGDKTGLVALDLGDHGSLILDGLGAVDEADAAFLGQSDGQGVVGNGLHDCGSQGNIQGDGALFNALAVLDQRGLQADAIGNALFRAVAGDQQIFAEGVAGFGIVVRHLIFPPRCFCISIFIFQKGITEFFRRRDPEHPGPGCRRYSGT